MRKKWIAGNWKMYHNKAKAAAVVSQLVAVVPEALAAHVMLCVPFTLIDTVVSVLKESQISCGGQNLYPADEGAFTGEISPRMLRDAGCEYVLVGHSERRSLFKESNAFLNQKMKAAIAEGLVPVLCVGETLDERDSGQAQVVVSEQVRAGLLDVYGEFLVAYEPVWAIGTGKVASPEEAQEMHAAIRAVLAQMGYSSDQISILYGGSVKPENADLLLSKPDIDGALVGGASLEAVSFGNIINSLSKLKESHYA